MMTSIGMIRFLYIELKEIRSSCHGGSSCSSSGGKNKLDNIEIDNCSHSNKRNYS